MTDVSASVQQENETSLIELFYKAAEELAVLIKACLVQICSTHLDVIKYNT